MGAANFADAKTVAANSSLARSRKVRNQYAATMAKWFGLNDSQIRDVFPNIINFDPNMGFMKS